MDQIDTRIGTAFCSVTGTNRTHSKRDVEVLLTMAGEKRRQEMQAE